MGAAMRRSHRGNVWGGVALLCFLAHLWVPHPKTQRRGLGAAQGEQWGQRGGFGPQQRGKERGKKINEWMRGSVSEGCNPLGRPWGRGDAGTQRGTWQGGSEERNVHQCFPPPPLFFPPFFALFGDVIYCTTQKACKQIEVEVGRERMHAGDGCAAGPTWFVQHRTESSSELLLPSQSVSVLLPGRGRSIAPPGAH